MHIKPITHSLLVLLPIFTPFVLNGQEAKPAKPAEQDSAIPATPAPDKKFKIEKISDSIFALGDIRVNKKTREISFPAVVEMPGTSDKESQAVVEYVLVGPQGKLHESLFLTNITPSHLNVAFKLCGFKESKHLFKNVNQFFQPQEGYQQATPEQKKKSRFNMMISWKTAEGKQVTLPINELVYNSSTEAPMEAGPWIYGGSLIHDGKYQADLLEDLFAIYTDRVSIGNYAGKGREDDTLWFPNHKIMPDQGTKVTFSITPFIEKK